MWRRMMYRICLIDDEPWVLVGLEYLVDWSAYGFEICGRYEHARQAIEHIRSCPPDAVISDIRMPGISGLELLGRIREENLPVEVVLVSAFADFSYAQEAISKGAFQYLLKPVQKNELEQCLVKLRECLDARDKNQAVQENIRHRSQLLQAGSIGQAVSELLGSGPENGCQIFVADCSFPQEAEDAFLQAVPCTGVRMEGNHQVLLGTTHLTGEELFQKLLSVAETVPQACFGLVLTEDLEKPVMHILGKARIARASAEFLEVSGFLRQPFPEEKERQEELLKAAAYDRSGIVSGQLDILEKDVKSMKLPIDRLFQLLVRVQDASGKAILPQDAHTYEDFLNTYRDCHALFASMREIFSEGSDTAQLAEVMKEIREHYASPRTLAGIAMELGVSQAALSQMIKRKTEKTYSELISARKLEKACELLTYSGETIVRIAELTGYSDQFYFSKQFKKAFGESPNSYRKRMQKQKR